MYKLNNTSAVTKVSFILYDGHCCGQVRIQFNSHTHLTNILRCGHLGAPSSVGAAPSYVLRFWCVYLK